MQRCLAAGELQTDWVIAMTAPESRSQDSQSGMHVSDFWLFFNHHFEVKTTPESEIFDESLRLRYQVYCLERGFKNHENFVDKKEFDYFDAHALHGIVRHRQTDLTVASVRLVRTRLEVQDSVFPLEMAYPDLLWQHGMTEQILPRQTTAEISRFAISRMLQQNVREKRYGKRSNALARAGWYFNGRRYPLVIFGLLVALMRMSIQHGITHWLAIMEPSLLRLLARFGINFESIGGLVDYYGHRQPCYGHVETLNARLQDNEHNLFELIQRDLGQYCRTALTWR
jgi:N-acyl amino acid synthase of PEP-CTERM/exosortase system